MSLKNTREDRIYAKVLADGKIHVTVPEGTEGAVLRNYETSDKKTGSVYELVYTQLVGKITKVGFYVGTYGRSIQVTVQEGDESPVVLSLGVTSNYGEDLMKKLLNIDMNKYVKIVPYSFQDKVTKKQRRGLTVYQKDAENKTIKVENYFWDSEAKKNINGYPAPKKDKITKTNPEGRLSEGKYKIYVAECQEFLIEKITEHFKLDEAEEASSDDDFDKQVEEINNSSEEEVKAPEKF